MTYVTRPHARPQSWIACWMSSLLFALAWPTAVRADTSVTQWIGPETVSRPGFFSRSPTLVSDPSGGMHLLWVESKDPVEESAGDLAIVDALMYACWAGAGWTEPADILVSPDGSAIWQAFAAADSRGRLHLLLSVASGGLYYTSAPVGDAWQAVAWAPFALLAEGMPIGQLPAALAVDAEDALHVVYTTREAGRDIVYIRSDDGGATWSRGVTVATEMPYAGDRRLVPSSVALSLDPAGHLHAGWTLNDSEGFGRYIMYARSSDGGESWSPAFTLAQRDLAADYEVDWLSLATDRLGQLVAVWTGYGRPPGRSYRVSGDGGLTWAPKVDFMPGLVGETEATQMVADSQGGVHLFTPCRTTTSDTGVRYLYWDGAAWTQPVKLPGPEGRYEAYGALATTAAIRLRSEIFVAYHDQGQGTIEVTYGVTGAPPDAPLVFPTDAEAPTREPQRSETLPMLEAMASPTPVGGRISVAEPAGRASVSPLVTAALSASGVGAIAVLMARRRRRR